jgi:hypothetical protein
VTGVTVIFVLKKLTQILLLYKYNNKLIFRGRQANSSAQKAVTGVTRNALFEVSKTKFPDFPSK